jgi:hypothetical protein
MESRLCASCPTGSGARKDGMRSTAPMSDATYFVGIGGQKCGTTWLADYLFSHPQVLPNPVKEMHVFDALFVSQRARALAKRRMKQNVKRLAGSGRDPSGVAERAASRELLAMYRAPVDEVVARYRDYFARRVRPTDRLFGEITPAYALLPPEGFAAILQAYPAARFVFLIRDPVDRFWSAVRQAWKMMPELDVHTGIDTALDHDLYVARSSYHHTLEALRDQVDDGAQLVAFYEDLFGPDSRVHLRRITDFLGIDYIEGDLDSYANRGVETEMPPERIEEMAGTFEPTYRYVAERYAPLPERWQQHLAMLSS